MSQESDPKFVDLLVLMSETYDHEISGTMMKFWWRLFEKYGGDEIEKAFLLHIESSRFFPKPADIIELIQGNTDDRAALAWDELLDGFRYAGSYASVVFADRRIMQIVLEMWGGWHTACQERDDELRFRRKDFMQLYRALSTRSEDECPRFLLGRTEADNAQKNTPDEIPPRMMISRDGARIVVEREGDRKTLPASEPESWKRAETNFDKAKKMAGGIGNMPGKDVKSP
ncbi:MAG: hypothetical protein GY847_01505 [Proteobacteria bacterium]|nr:hypothetical protein [Pseudomonadota bacterium]